MWANVVQSAEDQMEQTSEERVNPCTGLSPGLSPKAAEPEGQMPESRRIRVFQLKERGQESTLTDTPRNKAFTCHLGIPQPSQADA